MQVTTGKRRNPASIGYNNLMAISLPVSIGNQANTAISAGVALGLNLKIMSVSYAINGSTNAGPASFNIALGSGTYASAGSASYGTITAGGTFAIGDTLSVVVGGSTYKTTISSRNAGNNSIIAADMAAGINRNQPFGTTPAYFAYSSGAILYIMQVAYNVAGNATTLSTSVVSAAGTSTASGATLAGGQGSAGTYAAGTLAISGAPVAGDTILWTVGAFSATVTATDTSTSDFAGILLASINTVAGSIVTASRVNSGSSTVTITATSEGTAGNAIALSGTYTRTGGSTGVVTASGATLAGGIAPVAGTTPTMPALDNSNQTAPAQTAALGTALFPVDVPLNISANSNGVIYPTYPKNFDAIFPSASTLTVRVAGSANVSGSMVVTLWCVPYDVNAFNPELKANGFIPNPTNL